MNKMLLFPFALAAASSCGSQKTVDVKASLPRNPNIILILCDDLGYSDIGCYGSEIPTPNIDRLAGQGIRYRCFYNAARSAPTRASLMTGLYPHQAGVGALGRVPGYENYQAYLKDGTNTIPETLRDAGYFSFMTGKWHLNQDKCPQLKRGFDRALAVGGGWYFSSDPVADQKGVYVNDVRYPASELSEDGETWYTTERFVDYGLDFMDEALKEEKPFFWYLPFNAPHFPLQAPAEVIESNIGRYAEGYDVIRGRRWEKQKEMGLFDESDELTPVNPHPDYVPWADMTEAEKSVADRRMSIYASCIEEVDRNIGRVLGHLEELGIRDNTLIFFLSDNGGNAESGFPGQWKGPDFGNVGSKVWLGTPWANVANTPYFLYKHHAHQGGCCTPFIMSWPAAIPQNLWGSIDRENYGHIVDIMPTIIDVAGGSYPEQHAGSDVPPMEGTSLLPSILGGKVIRRNPIIVEHEGNKMLRDGDWKIVQEYEFSTDEENPWRLYNLREDPTEMHNLADRYPRRAAKMLNAYHEWADHIGVEPEITFKVGNWYTPVRDFGQD